MAQQNLQTQRELMLPQVDDIGNLDDAKEFLKKLLKIIEDNHIDVYRDLEAINSQV